MLLRDYTRSGSPISFVKAFRELLKGGLIIDTIFQKDRLPIVYFAAAWCENSVPLALFLKHGGDPDAIGDEYGGTALMHAAMLGKVWAVKLLLRYGADRHRVDKKGKNAFDHASGYSNGKNDEILDLLWNFKESSIEKKGRK